MTDRDVVTRVARIVDRALIVTPARKPGYKTAYLVSVKGVAAMRLMLSFRTDLSASRQQQIRNAVTSWNAANVRWRETGILCDAPLCSSPATTRGLCEHHHNLWYKAVTRGRPTDLRPRELTAGQVVSVRPIHSCGEECHIAWLAGLLEGEGSFGIARMSGHCYPRISLQMCAEDVVRRAARLLGAAWVGRRETSKPRWNPTFHTAITGRIAAQWMRRLGPLMGSRRRSAIDAALAAYAPIRLVDPPATCTVPRCDRPHDSRGLCHKHYMSWLRDLARGHAPRVTPLR